MHEMLKGAILNLSQIENPVFPSVNRNLVVANVQLCSVNQPVSHLRESLRLHLTSLPIKVLKRAGVEFVARGCLEGFSDRLTTDRVPELVGVRR